MKTEEKITVIQAPSNLWLKPPRVYILVLIVIIILAATFLTLRNRSSKPETTPANVLPGNELETTVPASPSAQIQQAGNAGGKRKPSPPPIPK